MTCLLAICDLRDRYDCKDRALFDSRCTGRRGCKTTSFKVEAVLDGARAARGGDGTVPQFDHAPHDEGAPRPASGIARDRSLRPSAFRASLDADRRGDPSAPRARAPSLTHRWLTACACLTPWQASISRVRPRAATATLRAAGRRTPLFAAMRRWPSRRVDARRAVLAARLASRGAPWRYRCVCVDTRTLVRGCGSSAAARVHAAPACVEVCCRSSHLEAMSK